MDLFCSILNIHCCSWIWLIHTAHLFLFLAIELKEVANDIIFGNSLKGKRTYLYCILGYFHAVLTQTFHRSKLCISTKLYCASKAINKISHLFQDAVTLVVDHGISNGSRFNGFHASPLIFISQPSFVIQMMRRNQSTL